MNLKKLKEKFIYLEKILEIGKVVYHIILCICVLVAITLHVKDEKLINSLKVLVEYAQLEPDNVHAIDEI